MNNDTPSDVRIDGMNYSQWLASGDGAGALIVDHARKALDATISSEQGNPHGAAQALSICVHRFNEIHLQCARWKTLAAMENMFRAYPDIVKRVVASVEMPLDGTGSFSLSVNDDWYEPGDSNEFCMETMERMEEIDGLEAINLAHDTLLMLCGWEHSSEDCEQIEALANDKSQDELQAMMAQEAPELDARVRQMWMEQATAPAKDPGRPKSRM